MKKPAPAAAAALKRDPYGLETTAHRQFIARRSAAVQAAFLLPHLKPGMRLLDAGCGGGSITVGLAEAVAPGEVIGVDVEEKQLKAAGSLARERGLANLRFETVSVYEIPYPDRSFDVVFSHAVLEHLGDPAGALREMRRVLKPGGVVGLRDGDGRGDIIHPPHPDLPPDMYHEHLRRHGGDGHLGARLKGLLREAGFRRVEVRAVYDTYATPEAVQAWAGMASTSIGQFAESEQPGSDSRARLERAARAWREWAGDPDALLARAWVEALAWAD